MLSMSSTAALFGAAILGVAVGIAPLRSHLDERRRLQQSSSQTPVAAPITVLLPPAVSSNDYPRTHDVGWSLAVSGDGLSMFAASFDFTDSSDAGVTPFTRADVNSPWMPSTPFYTLDPQSSCCWNTGHTIATSQDGSVVVNGDASATAQNNATYAGSGRVMTWLRSGAILFPPTWTLTGSLELPSAPQASAAFGYTTLLSVDGLLLTVGAPNYGVALGLGYRGEMFVFRRQSVTQPWPAAPSQTLFSTALAALPPGTLSATLLLPYLGGPLLGYDAVQYSDPTDGATLLVCAPGFRLSFQPTWGVLVAFTATSGGVWSPRYVLPVGADVNTTSSAFCTSVEANAATGRIAVGLSPLPGGLPGIAIFERPPTPTMGSVPLVRVMLDWAKDRVSWYGSSLAFSGDGNTLYVGDAHASRGGGNSLPGGVFKYSRVAGSGSGAPPVWSVVYVFYASDAADSALFGVSVAVLPPERTSLVVGSMAWAGRGVGAGALYLYPVPTSGLISPAPLPPDVAIGQLVLTTTRITPSGPPPGAHSSLGYAMAVSRDASTAAVCAPEYSGGTGVCYILSSSAAAAAQQQQSVGWVQWATLSPPATVVGAPGVGPWFGAAASLSADATVVVVSAVSASVGPLASAGVAIVYTYNADSGVYAALPTLLSASDGTATVNGYFGTAVVVSADGGTVVVGAPGANGNAGALYTFSVTAAGANLVSSFTLPPASGGASNGTTGDNLGYALAWPAGASGGVLFASAPYRMPAVGPSRCCGVVLVLVRQRNDWIQSAELSSAMPSSGTASAAAAFYFGWAIAVNDAGTLAAVAIGSSPTAAANCGSCLVNNGAVDTFSVPSGAWGPGAIAGARLSVSSQNATRVGDQFGYAMSMSLDGTTLVVGAYNGAFGGQRQGAVYVYSGPPPTASASWSGGYRIYAADGANLDGFGSAVALVGSVSSGLGVLVGSPAAAGTGSATSSDQVATGGVYAWAPAPPPAAVLLTTAAISGIVIGGVAVGAAIVVALLVAVSARHARAALRKRNLRRAFVGGMDAAIEGVRKDNPAFQKTGDFD